MLLDFYNLLLKEHNDLLMGTYCNHKFYYIQKEIFLLNLLKIQSLNADDIIIIQQILNQAKSNNHYLKSLYDIKFAYIDFCRAKIRELESYGTYDL